jgi:hypothetical protein
MDGIPLPLRASFDVDPDRGRIKCGRLLARPHDLRQQDNVSFDLTSWHRLGDHCGQQAIERAPFSRANKKLADSIALRMSPLAQILGFSALNGIPSSNCANICKTLLNSISDGNPLCQDGRNSPDPWAITDQFHFNCCDTNL